MTSGRGNPRRAQRIPQPEGDGNSPGFEASGPFAESYAVPCPMEDDLSWEQYRHRDLSSLPTCLLWLELTKAERGRRAERPNTPRRAWLDERHERVIGELSRRHLATREGAKDARNRPH